jgi:DNA-binding transcriptional LysR family regulator
MPELLCHRLIDKLHGADLLGWSDVLGHPVRPGSTQPVFACDDFEAMRLAALEGLGVGYLPDWVVGPDIKAGTLRQLFPDWSRQPRAATGIHALRAIRQPPARVTVFLDALKAHIGQPPSWAL